jgi:aspartyl-tRNA synthetase
VPSRMNPGCFYALPQSPQTFKQVLMVAGIDRYFQIVKCFRDEELRADRQPEFTQIDCEMAFVTQEDILNIFEGFIRHLFQKFLSHTFDVFPRMTWKEAMEMYGSDKPDTRFEMKLNEVSSILKGKGLPMFDSADVIIAMPIPGLASYSKKKIKELEKLAKSEEVGASALVWAKVTDLEKGVFDSSAKKFFSDDDLKALAEACGSKTGDLICMFCGPTTISLQVRETMGKFRALMGSRLGLRSEGYNALWVTDFPLLEYDEEEKRFSAMHHPFTSPNEEDIKAGLLDTNPGQVRSSGYDMVINGMEVGGGSVRIFDRTVQMKMFQLLGFTEEAAMEQFGFLMGAFEYGAPPHGGLAFGFDRLCAIIGGEPAIRNFIAFPKNNKGRDVMIKAPSTIDSKQMEELRLQSTYVPTEKKQDEGKEQ